jgi:hypothetical protein
MYGPSLCARFQRRTGSSVKISMFTSGCPFEDVPSGLYKMWEIPLILRTAPAPASFTVPGDDASVSYSGAWSAGSEALPSLRPHTRYTTSTGAAAELHFRGTGIALIAEKGSQFGSVEIYLDGKLAAVVDLHTKNFPRIASVEVFSALGLRPAPHIFRLVNTSGDCAAVEMFRVFD